MYLRPTATVYTYGLVLWPAGYHYAFDVAPRHIAKVEKCQTYLLCKPCGQICYLVAVFNLGCTVYFYVCTRTCVCVFHCKTHVRTNVHALHRCCFCRCSVGNRGYKKVTCLSVSF